MEIVIATNNENKVKEISNILKLDNIVLKSLKDEGICYDVEETGLTFAQNAIKKAKEYYALCNKPVIAEDSGLCIEEFNGFPGVFSKRLYEGKTEEEGNKIILEDCKDITNRCASLVAVYTYYDGVNLFTAIGEMHGDIMYDIAGDNGFSYDKIFYSYDLKKRLSEVSDYEKNKVSHRKRGLDKLKKVLELNEII